MAHHAPYKVDPERYISYYRAQAGNGLPGYAGGGVMYGSGFASGIGGLFKGLFRMAMPFFRRGISIAKPHLKSAAKNIMSDVVTSALTKSYNNNDENGQEGHGLMVMSRKPPGTRMRRGRVLAVKKTRRSSKTRSVTKSKRRTSTKRVKRSADLKRRGITIF